MPTSPAMTIWQKRQVALLYYFASQPYLQSLKQRVDDLLAYSDTTLNLAASQHRDSLFANAQWGNRNTAANWFNNAWSMLADFQVALAGDIARRAVESYAITNVNHYARGLSEFSQDWMTPQEEQTFKQRFEDLTQAAGKIDYTMDKSQRAGIWNDFRLARAWQNCAGQLSNTPRLRLRADITSTSGKVPPRTGVYLPLHDPYGAPQFCWVGTPAGPLQECHALNQFGVTALQEVGREDLWIDDTKMSQVIQKHSTDPELQRDSKLQNALHYPELASSFAARHAFTHYACDWIYVEQIHGELEDWAESDIAYELSVGPRVAAGSACAQAGYYFTPAKSDSRRYFARGDIMPGFSSDYGETIWQWDANQ